MDFTTSSYKNVLIVKGKQRKPRINLDFKREDNADGE